MNNTIHSESEFDEQKFKNLDLQNETFADKDFNNCIFKDCKFNESFFEYCSFIGCKFEGCDLSLIKIRDCKFIGTSFEKSKLIGVDWTNISKFNFQIEFESSTINYSNFTGLVIKKFKLINCTAQEVDFVESDLTGAQIEDTDLTNTKFLNTNLTNAKVLKSNNYFIDPKSNRLKNTTFTMPDILPSLKLIGINIE